MTSDIVPEPFERKTLIAITLANLETPYLLPAIVPATCVPFFIG